MIYISHLLPDEEMKELIAQTGAGVECLEFSVAENLDSLANVLTVYRRRLSYMGCKHLNVHGPFLDLNPVAYDREIQKATMLRYVQCYEAAMELRADKIIYHTCMYPDVYFVEGWADRMADFMNDFLENHSGIEILIENVLDREWKPVLDAAEKMQSEKAGICLDVGHAHCYSEHSVKEWAQNLTPMVKHLHLHDNDGTRDAHLGLGCGTIPWTDFFHFFEPVKVTSCTIECCTKEAVLASIEKIPEKYR